MRSRDRIEILLTNTTYFNVRIGLVFVEPKALQMKDGHQFLFEPGITPPSGESGYETLNVARKRDEEKMNILLSSAAAICV